MNQFKIYFLIIFCMVLTSCTDFFYCRNADNIHIVKQLPCVNCCFKGYIKPNLCPDAPYPYKLRCAANHLRGNVVLSEKIKGEPGFRVYDCPTPTVCSLPANNSKTDISGNCCEVVKHLT